MLKLLIFYLISVVLCQYSIKNSHKSCKTPIVSDDDLFIPFGNIGGIWYNLFGGKEINEHFCHMIDFKKIDSNENFSFFNVKDGFRVNETDTPFLYDGD